MVTPALFARWPDSAALASARQAEVEEVIRSTGFFRNKARNLIAMAQAVVVGHDGQVPDTMEALRVLPGVGRKTANILRGNAYGDPAIGVDTHVSRVSFRLGLTKQKDPDKIEADLVKVVPSVDQVAFCWLIQRHGREICVARSPRCSACPVTELCPKKGVEIRTTRV